MKSDFPALWAESPGMLRREPTNSELAGGFPCGAFDLQLWNELTYRLSQVYREVSNVLGDGGLPPSATDLHQLTRMIRSGKLWTYDDTGTVNALAIAPTPTHTALFKGLPFRVWPANTNTSGTVTLVVNGVGAVAVKKRGGANPGIGDIAAGVPLDLVHDGTAFRVMGALPSDYGYAPGASTAKAPMLCTLDAKMAANGSAPTSTDTLITYGTTVNNTFGTSAWNGTRFTVGAGEAGYFSISAAWSYSAPSNDVFAVCRLKKNGTIYIGDEPAITSIVGTTYILTSRVVVKLAVGDYVEAYANHQTGSTQPIYYDNTHDRTHFVAQLISAY